MDTHSTNRVVCTFHPDPFQTGHVCETDQRECLWFNVLNFMTDKYMTVIAFIKCIEAALHPLGVSTFVYVRDYILWGKHRFVSMSAIAYSV